MSSFIETSKLQSIPNFRDVGATVNQILGERRMKQGLLYRGARPDEASYQDRKRLVNDFKIKSIIDLRTTTEHIEQARKREAHVHSSAVIPQSNDAAAEPLKISGIAYHEINLNGRSFSRMLVSKTTWLESFWLLFLMLVGRRLDAAKVIAPYLELMGLEGISIESVDACTLEIREFFQVLADDHSMPTLVHCTQGKDRTGLTIMLVLFLLGIDINAVEHDYLMSGPELALEREGRLTELAGVGLSERFADVSPGLVGKVYEHIVNTYGTVERYLESIGVDRDAQIKVKQSLLADYA